MYGFLVGRSTSRGSGTKDAYQRCPLFFSIGNVEAIYSETPGRPPGRAGRDHPRLAGKYGRISSLLSS